LEDEIVKYPQQFVDRCKKVYPNFPALHNALDTGNVFAGRYLDDSRSMGIRYDEILSAKSLDDLKAMAAREKQKEALYREWWDYYEAQK
jgi:hypothetical protein